MNSWLLLSLLLAHVIADFYLQNDKYCKLKEEKKLKSWLLYAHSLIVGAISWNLVPTCDFGLYALGIVLSHLAIDIVKVFGRKGLWSFLLDQAGHLAVLVVVAFCFDTTNELPIQLVDYSETFSVSLFLMAILLSIKPANILIKLVLEKYQIGET